MNYEEALLKQIDIYIARNPIIYIVSHKGLFVNIGICLVIYHDKSAPKAPAIIASKAVKEATQAHQGERFFAVVYALGNKTRFAYLFYIIAFLCHYSDLRNNRIFYESEQK